MHQCVRLRNLARAGADGVGKKGQLTKAKSKQSLPRVESGVEAKLTAKEGKWIRIWSPGCAQHSGGKEGGINKTSSPLIEAKLATKAQGKLESKGVRDGGKDSEVERIWRKLFLYPKEWRDHRQGKSNSRFPDFIHKKTERGLWLDAEGTPQWVKPKLAALPLRTIEESIFPWNQTLSRYSQAGQYKKTMDLFQQMQRDGLTPDRFTLFPVLKACASLGLLEHGRSIHSNMKLGLDADLKIGSSLVDMYARCGSIEEAEGVFDRMPKRDLVTWTAMILGYVKCGEGRKALELYRQMQHDGMGADPVIYMAVLNACASVAALDEGRRTHKEIIQRGYESDIFVGSCLVDMYAKCGRLEEAERVFNQMPRRDLVAWTAMIVAYVKCGEGQQALELYRQMREDGKDPDPVTFLPILNACASLAALEEGKHVHKEIIRRGYESDVYIGNCLVDMYAKCGSIEEAEKVFNEQPTRNLVAWNAMLAGYGMHGHVKEALEHFKQMCNVIEVDSVTFISLLTACSHGGLVDDGLEYFKSMSAVYNISPTAAHYACLVDLLGRAGRLYDAEDLVLSMPMDPDATVWMTLLGACRAHVNVELGEHCANNVMELEPENAAGYVLLSDIHVAAGKWDRGKWDKAARVDQERLSRGSKKPPGRAWIEVNNRVHSFVADDKEHPQILEVSAELERLSAQMKDAGGWLDPSFVLRCVDVGKKEFRVCHHSEKLAIAFGLISTTPSTLLRIVKDLPLCSNCHAFIKLVSKIVGQTIIVRDTFRIHRFEDGLCSCKDLW